MLTETLIALAIASGGTYNHDHVGPARYASSTAYCLHGTMADGSYTRAGSVAMNILPLGTRIKTARKFDGRRIFTVRDRIGYGTELDFWTPTCGRAIAYGRHTVKYKVLYKRHKHNYQARFTG
jgi:3D (Asp-Asp-Asp) domain-containing protein